MFFVVPENPSLHTQISAIVISHIFDSQSFLCAICSGLRLTGGLVCTKKPKILHPMFSKGLNVPQNLGFYNLGFFSATSVIERCKPWASPTFFMKMNAPMHVQCESPVECCRFADLSVLVSKQQQHLCLSIKCLCTMNHLLSVVGLPIYRSIPVSKLQQHLCLGIKFFKPSHDCVSSPQ
ncbi:hypothetical protein AMTRI_Chr02g218450 [Amborella trichopoda]